MQLIINLPDRESTLAFHRQRWEEVWRDPQWANDDRPMELNEYGQMIVHTFYPVFRSRQLSSIAGTLRELLGGHPGIRCAVLTMGGVWAADVAWRSDESYQRIKGQELPEVAPEICIDFRREYELDTAPQSKRALYFDAGAIECWQCDLNGKMTYYLNQDPETAHEHSILCPGFPTEISD